MRFTLRCLASILALAYFGQVSAAQSKPLWSIGTFDRSSAEFRSEGIDFADAKQDPVFRVGRSKDSEDWQRFQPGPANGMTAGREHPFTIVFNLASPPKGVFTLRVGILYETPRLSHLRIDVNGHSGLFYFHPKLDYNAGDWEGTFVPQTSYDEKQIAVPAAFLRTGENKIVLTALDDPPAVENSLGAIAPGHTGLVYDALQFTNDPNARTVSSLTPFLVEPTIFYRGDASNLREIVEVYCSCSGSGRAGEATLIVNGNTLKQSYTGPEEFGEKRFEFEVPAWEGQTRAVFKLSGGDGEHEEFSQITPAKKWTLLIVPHEHLDIGFTDYPARVAELHAQSVDSAMDAIKRIPDFRWTVDGYWVAQQYMNGRSKIKQERFIEHLKSGKVFVPAEIANQHTGNASLEGLARALYGSASFAKQYSLGKPDTVLTVDVPSYSWSWASVMHDAGVKYFIGASNSWRAPIMLQGRWNERSPFYWEGPDGGRVLMWYSRAYLQLHTLFGSPWRMASVRDALPVFLQAYTRPDYTASTAIIFGSQLENTAFAREQAEIAGEWNKQYAWPRLEFATAHDAMARIDKEFGGKLPVVRGDLGPYWEDGYGSDAAYTAKHRANQFRVTTAEKLSTISAVLDPSILPDRNMLRDAWQNQLLYDEHTWTFVGATTQPENEQSEKQIHLKEARSVEGARQIDELVQRSWGQLSAFVAPRDNSLLVFNPLNWERSGIVSVDLPDGSEILDSVSGKAIPYEVLWTGKGISLPGFGPGYKRVRFEADAIPSVGYKLFTIKPSKTPNPRTTPLTGTTIENAFYRMTLDPAHASVRSLVDKQLGQELVDPQSPYRFGSYIYVSGGDDYPNNSLYRYGAALKPPALTSHSVQNGKIVSIRKVPYGTIVTMEGSAVNTPKLTVEITLFDSTKKIAFRYDLEKKRVLERESVYFAFPFRASTPSFAYATQNGFVNPAKDELPGGSHEWYIATPWAVVNSQNFTASVVPVDAPLVTFGDTMRGDWPAEFKPKSGTIFSWVMNNYWGTNFQAWQGGSYTFRYVISSARTFDPIAIGRSGQEELTPVESAQMPASLEKTTLPTDRASLISLDNDSVLMTTWKLAEDGNGTILRLVETSGREQKVSLKSDYIRFRQAWRTSIVEEDEGSLPVSDNGLEFSMRPFEILTIRLISTPKTVARGAAE